MKFCRWTFSEDPSCPSLTDSRRHHTSSFPASSLSFVAVFFLDHMCWHVQKHFGNSMTSWWTVQEHTRTHTHTQEHSSITSAVCCSQLSLDLFPQTHPVWTNLTEEGKTSVGNLSSTAAHSPTLAHVCRIKELAAVNTRASNQMWPERPADSYFTPTVSL